MAETAGNITDVPFHLGLDVELSVGVLVIVNLPVVFVQHELVCDSCRS